MKHFLLFVVVGSLVLSATIFAQHSKQLVIYGQVKDSTGGMFPDVKVTISGGALAKPISTVTAEGGSYQFTDLPAGTYRVVFDPSMAASCPTFSKVVKQDVAVVSGFTTKVDASLPIGAHEVSIVARADDGLVQVMTSLAAAVPELAVNLGR